MASIYYGFYISDSTVSGSNPSQTGLTPTFLSFTTTGGTQTNVPSDATISEVGHGWYQFVYDAESHGEATGVIDAGDTLTVPLDRYIPVFATKDSSRIQTGVNASGQVTLTPNESLIARTSTAQAGASSTITLDSGASSNNNAYLGHSIAIISGTGAGSTRQVVGYVGSTKIATINRAWNTNPDSTSVFVVYKLVGPILDTSDNVSAISSNVNINFTQAVPQSNTAQTVGDALNGARAQSFGRWSLIGTTLSLYGGDNTTVVRSFTLDSASAPTIRS